MHTNLLTNVLVNCDPGNDQSKTTDLRHGKPWCAMPVRSSYYQANVILNYCFENKNCLNSTNGAMQCKVIGQGHSTKEVKKKKKETL